VVQTLDNDLFFVAFAQDANVCGCYVLSAQDVVQPHWTVYDRPDGLRVRLDTADGAPPLAAAVAAVQTADLSEAAVALRWNARQVEKADLVALAAAAIADIDAYLLVADTATNVQVRAFVKKLAQQNKAIIKYLLTTL
jgi:hypothetical protein